MSSNSKAVLEAALSLSPEDRAELAERLMLSLDEQHQAEVERAWEEEIGRRLDQIDRGEVTLISAEEAKQRIRERKKI